MIVPTVRAGRAIILKWLLTDQTVDPPVPIAPPSPPTITIVDSSGKARINSVAMVATIGPNNSAILGVYSYTFTVPAAGPTGTWTSFVDAIDIHGVTSGSKVENSFQVI